MTTLSRLVRRAAISLLLALILAIAALVLVRYLIVQPVACAPRCTGVNLAERSLQGQQLRNTAFVDANLKGVDLRNADLREADFSGADLENADLRSADLRDAYLIGANLTGANLGGATLGGANLSGALFNNADLTRIDLTDVSLDGANFSQALLKDCKLAGAGLAGSNFVRANLTGADLTRANLTGATLSGADLRSAALVDAQLTGAWLNQANLTGVDLHGARLTGASLIGSQLTSANLENSSLRGALLVGANLDGANLRAADLTDIRSEPAALTKRDLELDPVLAELNELQLQSIRQRASLSGVESDAATRWPAAGAVADNLAPLQAGLASSGASGPAAAPTLSVTAAANMAPGVIADASAAQTGSPNTATADQTASADQNAQGAAGSQQARHVRVNFYINDIRLAAKEPGLYEADFSLDFHWFDPALVGVNLDQVDKTTIWDPAPEVVNGRGLRVVGKYYLPSVEPGANVRLSIAMKGLLASPFNLHTFPFDQQTLSLNIESSLHDSDNLIFNYIYSGATGPQTTKVHTETVPSGRYLASGAVPVDWTVQNVTVSEQLHPLPYDKSTWSQFRISIQLLRQGGVFLWRLLLLLVTITFLIWGIFWGDGDALGMRLWMLSGLLLVTAAANVLMLRSVPYPDQLTVLDLYLVICYALLALSAAAVVIIYRLNSSARLRRLGMLLNRGLLFTYPLLLLLINGAFYWFVVRT